MRSPGPSTGDGNSQVRYVTLTKDDPEFSQYLSGIGPKGLRAIAVESFAVNSNRERVTFALCPTPSDSFRAIKGFLTVARFELLPLSLGPVLLGAVAIISRVSEWSVWRLVAVVVSITGLHVAAFARNDIDDHQRGIDRLQRRRGSQALQRGWITVGQLRWLVRGALLLSSLVALPLLMSNSLVLGLLSLMALIAVLGFSLNGRGFKSQGTGDLVVGLCMGPLLTVGVGEVLAPGQWLWLLAVSLPLGLAAVIIFQMRQFESLLAERQVQSGTFVARLGFDGSKRLLKWELMLLPLLTAGVLWPWVNAYVLVAVSGAVAIGQWPLSRRILSAASPLASQLTGLSRQAIWFHLGLTVLLILAVGSSL